MSEPSEPMEEVRNRLSCAAGALCLIAWGEDYLEPKDMARLGQTGWRYVREALNELEKLEGKK